MGWHSIHASDALGDTIFSYEQVTSRELHIKSPLSVRCEDGYAHLLNWNFQNILVQIRLLGSTHYCADLQCEECHDQVSKKVEHTVFLFVTHKNYPCLSVALLIRV